MLVRVLTTFLTFIYLTFGTHAKENSYFDFSFDKDTLTSESTVNVTLEYNLPKVVKESRFKVKPVSKEGLVKVLVKDNWVDANTLWTEALSLSKNMKLKVNGGFYKSDLWFEILDTQTGIIYKTPKHPILNRNWFENYLKNLNKVIFDFARNATMVE